GHSRSAMSRAASTSPAVGHASDRHRILAVPGTADRSSKEVTTEIDFIHMSRRAISFFLMYKTEATTGDGAPVSERCEPVGAGGNVRRAILQGGRRRVRRLARASCQPRASTSHVSSHAIA